MASAAPSVRTAWGDRRAEFRAGGLQEGAAGRSQLNDFLGLPGDSGMHAVGGGEDCRRGAARAIAGPNGARAAGRERADGGVWTGPNGTTIAHGSASKGGVIAGDNGIAGGRASASGTVVKGA